MTAQLLINAQATTEPETRLGECAWCGLNRDVVFDMLQEPHHTDNHQLARYLMSNCEHCRRAVLPLEAR